MRQGLPGALPEYDPATYGLQLDRARVGIAAHRAEIGIGENLGRLSVGVENARDIIRDIEQALERV